MPFSDRNRPASESQYYTASDLRRVIANMGFAISYPKGTSMRPLIKENEHYVVVSKLENKPKVGDILAFEQIRQEKTAYIVHRLVGIEKAADATIYVMRGDNCLSSERIREEDIIGKVTEIFRNGKWKLQHAIPRSHFTMADRDYLIYTWIWMHSWPIRKMYLRLRGHLAKIKHKLA